jgi:hypothetical protein
VAWAQIVQAVSAVWDRPWKELLCRQITVIVLPIFEQRLRQLGQTEVDRPILESIGT